MLETENVITSDSERLPAIKLFRGEHGFLSNFYPCKIRYTFFVYSSVEHAYQAAKCIDSSDAMRIRNAAGPGLAKRMGKDLKTMGKVRADWDRIKLDVMSDLLWQKFVINPELRARLVATGERTLVEGNHHGDEFWGQVGNVGHNHLGNLLMRLRTVGRYLEENKTSE